MTKVKLVQNSFAKNMFVISGTRFIRTFPNIDVNQKSSFLRKISARCNRVHVLNELVVSRPKVMESIFLSFLQNLMLRMEEWNINIIV